MPGAAPDEQIRIAKTIRAACVQAAQQGYERAAADGLCDEGALRWPSMQFAHLI